MELKNLTYFSAVIYIKGIIQDPTGPCLPVVALSPVEHHKLGKNEIRDSLTHRSFSKFHSKG